MIYEKCMQNLNCLNLNGRLLRLFILVYDTNSVSRAAELLDLNQSTVSHSLEKLRACLSDPLFVKSGRGILPTERATLLAPRIRELLANIEALEATEDYLPEHDTQPVAIASNVLALMPIFVRLRENMQNCGVAAPLKLIELGSRANIEETLESNLADLVISIRRTNYSNSLKSFEFLSDNLACFYDPKIRGPIETIADYAAANHAVVDFGSGRKSIVDATLEANSLERKIKLIAPSIGAVARLTQGTDMVVTMPSKLKFGALSAFSFCPPPIAFPEVVVDLIWHRRSEHSGRGRWIRDMVMSCLPEEAKAPNVKAN